MEPVDIKFKTIQLINGRVNFDPLIINILKIKICKELKIIPSDINFNIIEEGIKDYCVIANIKYTA